MESESFGICICGLNGSGKTTLGRELARKLGLYPMDVENYYFDHGDLTYSNPHSREDVRAMLVADIARHPRFVLSSVSGNLGEEIECFYRLVIYLEAPWETRKLRIKNRNRILFGGRAEEGGDLYEQEQNFLRFAAGRNPKHIERWLESVPCRVLRADAMLPIACLVAQICEEIQKTTA